MRRILLVGIARENSTRVKNKMTRPFGDSCLYDIYLKKFERISEMDNPFHNIIMGISKSDEKLWDMSINSKIEIAERSSESVSPEYRGVIALQRFIEDYEGDYIMIINGCCPYLKEETIIKMGRFFKENEHIKSMTCGRDVYNFFWDKDSNRPINNPDIMNFSTARVNPLIEQVHCVHIYSKEFLFKNDRYWDFKENDPHIYLCDDTYEFLDIDTEFEFDIAESVYHNNKEILIQN